MHMPPIEPTLTKGSIIIEDDVWICYGATILSGVTIGKGSIIAAKSIVAKDIPPYSIVINGDVKKRRFSDTVIQKLQDIDLRKIKEKELQEISFILDTDITETNIDMIISKIL